MACSISKYPGHNQGWDIHLFVSGNGFASRGSTGQRTVYDIALLLHSSPATIRKYLAIPENEFLVDRTTSWERQQLALQQKQQEADKARRLAREGHPIEQISAMLHDTCKSIQNYWNSSYRITDGHYNARIPGKLAPMRKIS